MAKSNSLCQVYTVSLIDRLMAWARPAKAIFAVLVVAQGVIRSLIISPMLGLYSILLLINKLKGLTRYSSDSFLREVH